MNTPKLLGAMTGLLIGTYLVLPVNAAAPDGAGPWADAVVTSSQGLMKNGSAVPAPRSNPASAVGVAENDTVDGNFFSLGFGGSITLSFDNPMSNGVIVVEATNPGYPDEKINVELSANGSTWLSAGTITQDGSVSMPDNLTCAKYVRITDISNPADFADDTADAYDVDGVQASQGEPCEVPTPTPTPTTPPSNGGGPGDGKSDGRSDGGSSCPSCTAPPTGGSQVLGASTGGQVLGASTDTLAATGTAAQALPIIIAVLSGMATFAIGVRKTKRHEIS